jgi:DNA-binding winged helix-turn-helix (wHTH) protein
VINDERDALRQLTTQLDLLSGIRPVFLLDDFDRIYRTMDEDKIAHLHELPNLSTTIFATSRRLEVIKTSTVDSPFYYFLSHVRLSGLLKDEAVALIEGMLASTNEMMPEEDVEFILDQAGGHPQLLISATKLLWEEHQRMTTASGNAPLSREHRDHLTVILRPEFDRCFNLYWNHLDELDKVVLLKILRGQKCDANDEKLAKGILMHRGLVVYDEVKKVHKPFSPLFAEFLSKQTPTSASKRKLELTGTEAGLLNYLQSHANQLCTFDQLLDAVWKPDEPQSREELLKRRTQVTVAISRLRSKLKQSQSGEQIASLRDRGYRYIPANS